MIKSFTKEEYDIVLENTRKLGQIIPEIGKAEWFKLKDAYTQAKSVLYKLPTLSNKKADIVATAIGLYTALFGGVIPPSFPPHLATILVVSSYNYLKTSIGGNPFKDGPTPYLAEATPPQGVTSAINTLSAYCTKVTELPTGAAQTVTDGYLVEVIVANMNLEDEELKGKAIDFGKLFLGSVDDSSRWGIFAIFLRLLVKELTHIEMIWGRDRSRSNATSFCGLSDSDCFKNPKKDQWALIRNGLTMYAPLLGHYCMMTHIHHKSEYEVLKRFFAMRFEFFGLSLLTMLKQTDKLLGPVAVMNAISSERLAPSILQVLASIIIYVAEKPTLAKETYGSLIEDINNITDHDAKAGKFSRLFSTEYLTWLNYARQENLGARVGGITAGLCGMDMKTQPQLWSTTRVYALAREVGIKLLEKLETDDQFASAEWKSAVERGAGATEPIDIGYEEEEEDANQERGPQSSRPPLFFDPNRFR